MRPVSNAEFCIQTANMPPNGLSRYEEPLGYFAIIVSLGNESKNFGFPGREVPRVLRARQLSHQIAQNPPAGPDFPLCDGPYCLLNEALAFSAVQDAGIAHTGIALDLGFVNSFVNYNDAYTQSQKR